jgi:hypothetical protein
MPFIAQRALGAIAEASLITGPALALGDADQTRNSGPVHKEQKPWGIAGDAKAAKRTVEFRMTDNMRFSPTAWKSGRARPSASC